MSDVQIIRLQKQQLDALNNIYLSDLQILRSTFPIKFSVICHPFSELHQQQYRTKVHIQFTKQYPKAPPKLQIEPLTGITQDNIVAMQRKVDQLLRITLNRPLVYDVVEAVRDWIQEYLVEGKDAMEEETTMKPIEEVFERPKYATYTPVNAETFANWKRQFEAEMNQFKKKKKDSEDDKLTGKQWFKQHKEIHEESDDEDDDDDDDEEEKDEN